MNAFRFAKCATINVREASYFPCNQYRKVSSPQEVFDLPDHCLLEKENMAATIQNKMGEIKGWICVLLENLMSA